MNPSDVDLRPVSAQERQRVGMAAQAAFLKMCADDPEWLPSMITASGWSKSKIAEHWRHGQVKRITQGRARRVSELTQRDAGECLGKFADMAGQDVRAFEIYVKNTARPRPAAAGDDANALRQWRWKINRDAPKWGYNAAWQLGYLKRVFKINSLDDATAHELSCLYKTMRSRFLKKQKAASADES